MCGELTESAFEALRHKDIFRYRAATIKSGQVLEVEVYPLWNTKNEVRAAKVHSSREAQQNLNDRNAKKKLIRKINANFTPEDLHVTLTYKRGVLPEEEQARRDIRNFIRRVRTYRRKNGLSELKYVYVIEFYNGDGRRTRVHHHVIMSGMDRKTVKSLWPHGSVRVDELEPEDGTLEGLARYITKQPTKSKRWQASRNLKEPTITTADTKISKRQAERMAQDMDAAAPMIFSKLFPEYDFDEVAVKSSKFVAGAYIYAKMHLKPEPPPRKTKKQKKRG
ncbi:MAG: hypothetical protein LBD02_00950 [Christensenellaceae bacterium]|nr:hypothetical protein [Christensenellaceae bacterium]